MSDARKLAEKALRELGKKDLLYTHHGNVCVRDEAFDVLAKHFEAFGEKTFNTGKDLGWIEGNDAARAEQRSAAAQPEPCERFHVHPAEWDALVELARVAQRYHDETGHGTPGATAQCDPICEALKAWRKAANPDG